MYKLVRMTRTFGPVMVSGNEAIGNWSLVKLNETLLSAELFLFYPFKEFILQTTVRYEVELALERRKPRTSGDPLPHSLG